jgi:hypothetical protein
MGRGERRGKAGRRRTVTARGAYHPLQLLALALALLSVPVYFLGLWATPPHAGGKAPLLGFEGWNREKYFRQVAEGAAGTSRDLEDVLRWGWKPGPGELPEALSRASGALRKADSWREELRDIQPPAGLEAFHRKALEFADLQQEAVRKTLAALQENTPQRVEEAVRALTERADRLGQLQLEMDRLRGGEDDDFGSRPVDR